MFTTHAMHLRERNDADLVAECLAGSRDAFREIVQRYQNLICSLAYSGTGSVCQSEDIAQETFIAAWTQLRSLREPEKLRSWLCGIVRNRVHKKLRDEGKEPLHMAESLDQAQHMPASEALPSEQTITREEEEIVWRSLERIPVIYREPLVLFYREHKSIEHVAKALELSEDAVKQRLSRGRKLLQEEVQTVVENTLSKTAPGQAFSGSVLAMLPLAAGPAATAGVGIGAKSSAAAKTGFLAAWLVPLAPFLGIAAGVVAQWLLIRDTTAREHRAKSIITVVIGWVVYIGLAVGGESAVHSIAHHLNWNDRLRFVAIVGFWWLFTVGTVTLLAFVLQRVKASLQEREKIGAVFPKPMRSGTLAGAVIGGHLAMFSWLISLTWRAHDLTAVAIATGTMVLMILWAFLRIRYTTGVLVIRALGQHVTTAGIFILLILNLRCEVWVATAYQVSVGEARHLLPTWIVPVLSLALVLWAALMVTVANRTSSSRGRHG